MHSKHNLLDSNFYLFFRAGTTFDITVPFTYNLPNSTANLVYTGRKIEDEHSAVFEMIEDLLNKYYLNSSKKVGIVY